MIFTVSGRQQIRFCVLPLSRSIRGDIENEEEKKVKISANFGFGTFFASNLIPGCNLYPLPANTYQIFTNGGLRIIVTPDCPNGQQTAGTGALTFEGESVPDDVESPFVR